jgi:release factor glutamine methyltransferase
MLSHMQNKSIKTVLAQATAQLPTEEAAIEAQLLLQHVLGKNRAFIIAHGDDTLDTVALAQYGTYIKRRQLGEPIAYIIGEREFYGLSLTVSPATLIPRADTETLVDAALAKLSPTQHTHVLDLGTGSGAIALAIAKMRPDTHITALDASPEALAIAQQNAKKLGIPNVQYVLSDWFSALKQEQFDVIVSNPPYIQTNDPHLSQGDLRFEPATALASGDDGLLAIKKIVISAPAFLNSNGWLMFEHGYNQADSVAQLMALQGFSQIETINDLGGNNRVTLGQLTATRI